MENPGYSNEEGEVEEGGGQKTEVYDFKSKKSPQFIAALSANLAAFAFGTVVCWSATSVPKLREDPDFADVLTDSSVSWISSIVTLGAMCSCFPIGLLVDRIGRRKTMLCLSTPFLAGWLLIYFAQNIGMILAGRFITGFTGGAFAVTCPLFIAETSEAKIRGTLISGYDLMIGFGMLLIYVVGTFIGWRDQALVCAFVPVVFHIAMMLAPETPRYYLSKGMDEEAMKSLCRLRGTKDKRMIKPEFVDLKESIAMDSAGLKDRALEFRKKSVQKPFFLSLVLFFFQVSSGIIAVFFYTVEIFDSAGVTLNSYHSSIIIGAVQCVASVASALVVDRFGRKILMYVSEVLMVLSLAGLGTFFHVKKNDPDFATLSLGWLPLASLTIYLIGYSVGMGPIPFSIMPEILPQKVRGLACSLVITFKWGISFFLTFFFTDLINEIGRDGVFWLFGGCCLLGLVYIFFVVPETNGNSLEKHYFEDDTKTSNT